MLLNHPPVVRKVDNTLTAEGGMMSTNQMACILLIGALLECELYIQLFWKVYKSFLIKCISIDSSPTNVSMKNGGLPGFNPKILKCLSFVKSILDHVSISQLQDCDFKTCYNSHRQASCELCCSFYIISQSNAIYSLNNQLDQGH